MTRLRQAPLRRRTLWLGLIAVLVPVAALAVEQFRLLVSLRQHSEDAEEKLLRNRLHRVDERIIDAYETEASWALVVPASWLTQRRTDKLIQHLCRKQPRFARAVFLVNYASAPRWSLMRNDRRCRLETIADPDRRALTRAIRWSQMKWEAHHEAGDEVEPRLVVDEGSDVHRIISLPITDDERRVVGVVGLVLDEEDFLERVLPQAIRDAFPEALRADADLAFAVRDKRSGVLATYGPYDGRRLDDTRLTFSRLFHDRVLGLQIHGPTPAELAQRSFAVNVVSLVLLLAIAMGGVVLAFRAAAREVKLSNMKTDFVSNVSHELRTPLASIRVFGEFLRRGRVDDPAKVREYGEYIETESQRLTQLINNILDFSRIDSGRKTYEMERLDLEEVVEAALKTFSVRLAHQGFSVAYEGPDGSLPAVEGDRQALVQALHNLVDNAVKYSGSSRTVRVTLRSLADRVELAVEDRGVGIARDEQQRIFERFHRVGTGAVHDVRGSGLGLAIVSHVVRAHGGTIEVRSEVGRGSRFAILLPHLEARDAAPGAGAVRSPSREAEA